MKNFRIFLSFCFLSSFVLTTHAQNNLNSQFQQLKEESNNYQDFKVVKQTALDAFWNRVQDSVNVNKKKLSEARQEIEAQKAQLEQLQQQVKQKEEQMQKNDEASQQVTVLGMNVDKSGYATFSYIIYALLLAVLGFFFVRYQSSNRVTMTTRKEYEETRQQVDEYKKKLLETQTALGRELQTERNRVDEMLKEINSLRSQMANK